MFKLFAWLKKLVFVIWLASMSLAGVWLSLENSEKVSLTVFSFPMPEAGLGLILCVTLFCGFLLGFMTWFLVSRPAAVAKNREIRQANKQITHLRNELEQPAK